MQSDTILRTRQGLFLTAIDRDVQCLVDTSGTTIPVSDLEVIALEVFSVPRTVKSGLLSIRGRIGELEREKPDLLLELIDKLVQKGVLTPETDEIRASVSSFARGMFGSPIVPFESAVQGNSADVVFLGMPYEMGVTGGEGAKKGPGYLRRCTRSAFDYEEKGSIPLGWWDPKSCRQVMEGIRLRDIGDIACHGTTRNGKEFNRLHDAVKGLLLAKRLPVIMGGDHSISLATIAAASKVYPGIGILHFDAHADVGSVADMGNWRTNCTHGNFMSWVLRDLDVSCLVQMGVRHLTPRTPYSSAKVKTFASSAEISSIETYLSTLDKRIPYYITFDVDCLDPQVVSQTGTPIPGGYSYQDALRLLRYVGNNFHVVAMDFVELAPRQHPDTRDGLLVGHLLFEFLASIYGSPMRTTEVHG